MSKQSTLWIFTEGVLVKQSIIVQLGSYCEPTVIKVVTDDTLVYTVDYDTYEKWDSWYSLKSKERVYNLPTDKFEKVYTFDIEFFTELANLDR